MIPAPSYCTRVQGLSVQHHHQEEITAPGRIRELRHEVPVKKIYQTAPNPLPGAGVATTPMGVQKLQQALPPSHGRNQNNSYFPVKSK